MWCFGLQQEKKKKKYREGAQFTRVHSESCVGSIVNAYSFCRLEVFLIKSNPLLCANRKNVHSDESKMVFVVILNVHLCTVQHRFANDMKKTKSEAKQRREK